MVPSNTAGNDNRVHVHVSKHALTRVLLCVGAVGGAYGCGLQCVQNENKTNEVGISTQNQKFGQTKQTRYTVCFPAIRYYFGAWKDILLYNGY